MIAAQFKEIHIDKLRTWRECSLEGSFFMGYFEISASQERSQNNRVLFNIAAKYRATDSLRTRPVIARANSYAFTGWDK